MSADTVRITWSSWPARERPFAACVGLVVVFLFGLAGASFSGNPFVGAIAGFALFCCLQRFYFPVRCSIGDGAASVRTLLATRTMALSSVRRVAQDGKALLLSARSVSSTADVVSGFVLPLPRDGAERIVREALARIGPNAMVIQS